MPKTKRDGEAGLGDWSSTGTFLRKPSSGWLHEERELKDGSSINYQIKVRAGWNFSGALTTGVLQAILYRQV